jgi:hypothetical protein
MVGVRRSVMLHQLFIGDKMLFELTNGAGEGVRLVDSIWIQMSVLQKVLSKGVFSLKAGTAPRIDTFNKPIVNMLHSEERKEFVKVYKII